MASGSPPRSTPTETNVSQVSSRDSSPLRTLRGSSAAKQSDHQSRSRVLSPSRNLSANTLHAGTPSTAAFQRASIVASTDMAPTLPPDLPKRPSRMHQDEPSSQHANVHSGPRSSQVKSPATLATSRRSSLSSIKQSDSESLESSQTSLESPANVETGARASSTISGPQNSTTGLIKSSRGITASNSKKLETVEEADHSHSPETIISPTSGPIVSRQIGACEDQLSNADRTSAMDKNQVNSFEGLQHEAGLSPVTETHGRQKLSPNSQPSKARGNSEDMAKSMVVETETVTSIPQATANTNSGERAPTSRPEGGNTIRKKYSNDTVRPKKERKTRKPPSIMSGAGSSKADMFEAKVASEIEGESTDSDETFVYESSTTEPRARLHHSRTPSTTSVQSLAERRGPVRSVTNASENSRAIRGKRSMKFASNSYSHVGSGIDDESGDRDREHDHSTLRPPSGKSVTADVQQNAPTKAKRFSSAPRSPLEKASPFSQASKLRGALNYDSKSSSKSRSPKLSPGRGRHNKKGSLNQHSGLDGGESDTERSPLIPLAQNNQSRATQRLFHPRIRRIEYYEDTPISWIRKSLGILLVLLICIIVISGGLVFFFATTTPLYSLALNEIQNVLASEQEIMLDLVVSAINPNVVPITIEHTDINIFAKSPYVGSEECSPENCDDSELHISNRPIGHERASKNASPTVSLQWLVASTHGVDEGTDPVDEPESDGQTMLLGRVFHLDSALSFESSFFKHESSHSSGELRLKHPGNKTEAGGTKRWEHVMQHSFELIVRGVLKYQLPLSGKRLSKSVSASIFMHPEKVYAVENS